MSVDVIPCGGLPEALCTPWSHAVEGRAVRQDVGLCFSLSHLSIIRLSRFTTSASIFAAVRFLRRPLCSAYWCMLPGRMGE
jgi:hypothetical protein